MTSATPLQQAESLLDDLWYGTETITFRGWMDIRRKLVAFRRSAAALGDPEIIALLEAAIEQVNARVDLAIAEEYQERVQRLGAGAAA